MTARKKRSAIAAPTMPQEGPEAPTSMEGSGLPVLEPPEAIPARLRKPGKLTEACLTRICERIEAGTPIRHACLLEGVTPQALHVRRSADPDVAFAVDAARARAVDAMRLRFLDLVEGDRRSALALLKFMERADPDTYGEPERRVALSGPNGGPIELSASRPPASIAEAIARADALRAELAASIDVGSDGDPSE
jgi:hypothetical protein